MQHIKGQSMLAFAAGHLGGGLFSCVSVSKSQEGVTYNGCLGELSCSCPFAMQQRQVCKHLEAAEQQQPFSHSLRLQAASYVVSQGLLEIVDETDGTCTCR